MFSEAPPRTKGNTHELAVVPFGSHPPYPCDPRGVDHSLV